MVYLGTNNLIREVAVKNVKAFEETFLLQMEAKLPDVLKEFKKGALPEDGIAKMVKLAQELIPQFKN
jgi:F-type H+-transporting ATPase subunit alpha